MDHKYGIYCDSNYILSRGDNRLSLEHLELVTKIYNEEITDLFGKEDRYGRQLTPGKIDFMEDRINPEGVRQYLLKYVNAHGTFVTEPYEIDGQPRKRIVGYTENDTELNTIVIVDHVGLLSHERGYNKKENIDKLSEHMVWMRNICRLSPVLVSQFNRELGKTDRLRFSGEQLQPTLEDFKNSGNLSEDASMVIALFNPTNYPHLDRHLGYNLRKIGKGYRSMHILASRNTETNVNLSFIMKGKTGKMVELPKAGDDQGLERVYNYVSSNGLN